MGRCWRDGLRGYFVELVEIYKKASGVDQIRHWLQGQKPDPSVLASTSTSILGVKEVSTTQSPFGKYVTPHLLNLGPS
jgi:hypothetical protein